MVVSMGSSQRWQVASCRSITSAMVKVRRLRLSAPFFLLLVRRSVAHCGQTTRGFSAPICFCLDVMSQAGHVKSTRVLARLRLLHSGIQNSASMLSKGSFVGD